MTFLFVAIQTNTPHHADKTKLLPPDQRPEAYLTSLTKIARGRPMVAGANEMWPGIIRFATTDPLYEAFMPFPNNYNPMLLGNGFVWNDLMNRKRPVREVAVKINTGTGDRIIHQPQARFRPDGSRTSVPIINVHAPRMDLDPDGNHRTHAAAIKRGNRVALLWGRCIIMGDPNGPIEALYRAAGWTVFQHRSGFIACKGDITLKRETITVAGVVDVWSDHPLLSVEVWGR